MPNRQIISNIMIVQEVIHSMRNQSNRNCMLASKVDLEKAYDRLNWSFIREMLLLVEFPRQLVDIIMDLICSSTF